ncbi:MAG TPA: T9SS type A sorting domain-containing protein [Flavipsychrobacter sp.]|nr:T9SS type A sorting domain-containing protein [Flavipsychrobacter sp.]
MKYFLFLFTALSIASVVNAQLLHPVIFSMQGLGGDDHDEIFTRPITTYDGGFIVTISSRSTTGNLNTTCSLAGKREIFNKYNPDGTAIIWQKCVADSQDRAFPYLFPFQDGSYVLGGSSFSISEQDFLIRKFNSNDGVVWSKKYGGTNGELLRDMAQTKDGGFIMLGVSNSDDGDVGFHHGGVFNDDIWILKLDSNGNKEWSTVIGGMANDEAFCVVPRSQGGYYVVGSTFSTDGDCIGNHGNGDGLVVRLDDTGGKVWARCLGGSSFDAHWNGWGIENKDGGVLFTTDCYSTDGDVTGHISATGVSDFWLVDIDSNNVINWNKCYGGSNSETPNTMCRSTDGTLWIGGISGSADGQVGVAYGSGDAYIVHVDTSGNFLSSKVLGANEKDETTLLYPLNDGLIMAGGTYSAPDPSGGEFPSQWYGLTDVFLARFAPWTTGITNLQQSTNLKVYPNPATDKISIQLDQRDYNIKITSIAGSELSHQKNVSGTVMIDVSQWSKGIYYLQATAADGTRSTTKFFIN